MKVRIDLAEKDADWVLRVLLTIDFALVIVYLTAMSLPISMRLRQIIDVNHEVSVPTWFASTQLLITGLIFLALAQLNRSRSVFTPIFFPLVGAGFIFLSIDEAAVIHETLSALLQGVDALPKFADGHGVWIALYAVIGVVLLAITCRNLPILAKDYRKETLVFAAGMAVFLAGGVGLEIFGYSIPNDGTNALINRWQVAFEELFEFIGVSVALYAGLLFILRFTPQDDCSRELA